MDYTLGSDAHITRLELLPFSKKIESSKVPCFRIFNATTTTQQVPTINFLMDPAPEGSPWLNVERCTLDSRPRLKSKSPSSVTPFYSDRNDPKPTHIPEKCSTQVEASNFISVQHRRACPRVFMQLPSWTPAGICEKRISTYAYLAIDI